MMEISARRIIAVLGMAAFVAAWCGYVYWIWWTLTDSTADAKDNMAGLAFAALPLAILSALGIGELWERNPTITLGGRSKMPRATAKEVDNA